MATWQSVVVHPLGLAGYALACVFGLLAKFGPTAQYPWLAPVAVAMAFVALVGGLLLGWRRRQKPVKAPGETSGSARDVAQTTTGDRSPAIANVKGDVSINYDGRTSNNKNT